jgi:hypothetical protein
MIELFYDKRYKVKDKSYILELNNDDPETPEILLNFLKKHYS